MKRPIKYTHEVPWHMIFCGEMAPSDVCDEGKSPASEQIGS